MSEKKAQDTVQQLADACTRCGACVRACSMLHDADLTPGEIAQGALELTTDQRIQDVIQRCSLCGLCGQYCPLYLNPEETMAAIRELMTFRGKGILPDYERVISATSIMQVDREWNYFSLYRDTYDIDYSDLLNPAADTCFIPGCTLAAYAPELTRSVFAWLQEQGFNVSFSVSCCGTPLSSIGQLDRAERLLEQLQEDLMKAGIRQVITACPNCHKAFSEGLPEMKVKSVYELLGAAGMVPADLGCISIHDSCPDRNALGAGLTIRTLLSQSTVVEMKHHGHNTLCCGSGGIVSLIDSDLSQQRARTRVSEFEDTGASICVTACMACTQRLSKAVKSGRVAHCLEFIFDTEVDQSEITDRARAMWEGDWGAYNEQRLNQATNVDAPFRENVCAGDI